MNILKLTPSCKDYLWGGSRLRTDFGMQSDFEPLAEAWVLSCHPGRPQLSAGRHHVGGLLGRPPGLPWHGLHEI